MSRSEKCHSWLKQWKEERPQSHSPHHRIRPLQWQKAQQHCKTKPLKPNQKKQKKQKKTNLLSSTDPQSTTTSVGQVKTGASVSTTAFCLNQISGKKNKKQTNKKLLICCAQENPPNGATS
jgi:hypothetical protein